MRCNKKKQKAGGRKFFLNIKKRRPQGRPAEPRYMAAV